jgi:hypothetical protein
VKLGILTDGMIYQLFSDTEQENLMDNEPFASVDLAQVAQEQITDDAFDALMKVRRDTFNPEDIGADARRKIFISAYVEALAQAFRDPDERFVRTLMDMANIEGRRMPRLIEEHTLYISEAMNTFFDKKLLERVGFADRTDIVKVVPAEPQPTPLAQESTQAQTGEADIVTTDAEMDVYQYVKQRLPFLIARDEDLYRRLDNIYFRDYRGTFAISYKQNRKGRLLNFREGTDTRYRFEFPESGEIVTTDTLSDIDERLLDIFMTRVEELG